MNITPSDGEVRLCDDDSAGMRSTILLSVYLKGTFVRMFLCRCSDGLRTDDTSAFFAALLKQLHRLVKSTTLHLTKLEKFQNRSFCSFKNNVFF